MDARVTDDDNDDKLLQWSSSIVDCWLVISGVQWMNVLKCATL